MFQTRSSIVLTAIVALASLLAADSPVSAARYGGRGGNYGGRSGYYGGRGGYYGGRGYYGGYGWYGPGVSIGIGGYPYGYGYSDYGYSSSPDVQYVTPSYYYTPSTTVVTPAPTYDTGVSQASFTQPSDRAHIEVRVPAPDAQITFDGDKTQQQGRDREFISPPLTPGKSFTYSIEARWMENGRMVNQTRAVTVSAGQNATVDFTR